MSNRKSGLRPCAVAVAVALALGLTGCGGGGGGGNTRPTHLDSGGNINVGAGDTVVWNNSLTTPGGLTKNGDGRLILTGGNLYTGGTTINAGTLQIGNGGTAGSILGDVTDNGSLVFNHSDNVIFDGIISGRGSLTQAGTGKLTLISDNTFTGGTTINGGTLQLGQIGGAIGPVGSIVGDVTDNGSLVFARDIDQTFDGVIRGSGSLEQAGTQTLTLTGNNTYAGGTTLSGGSLQIGNGGTTGSIVGDVTESVFYGSLIFNRSDDSTYGGVISGSGGVIKLGGGTLTMSGASTLVGGYYVKDGVLKLVSGAAITGAMTVGGAGHNASLEVESGVALSSTVTIEGDGKLNNAGTVISSSPGTSAVQGYSSDSSIVVSNHDGGLLQGDYSQPGLDIPGVNLGPNSTLSNIAGSTIRGYTGVATGGIVNNIGSSIIGETGDGIEGGTIVNNSDGGNIRGGLNPNLLIDISIGVKTIEASASVNNSGGSTIKGGYYGVGLFGGGSVTNDGGSIISGGTGITISGNSGVTGIVKNTGGSTIIGERIGVAMGAGGVITNGQGSTIEATATAGGDCAVTPSCSIYVPVYGTSGSNGTNVALSLTNAGFIVGDVQLDPAAVNDVNLIAGGFIRGALKIGSNAQSTLRLDGDTGTTQLYSNAVTGTTTFGGIVVKDGGGTWVVDSSDLQGVVDTFVNAGSLQATQTLSGNVTVQSFGKLDGVPGVAGELTNVSKVAVHGGDSSVGGNYTQSSAGTLAVSLGSKLAVTGTAALSGGMLEVTGADSGYVANTHTEVLTATGGVSGTFDQLVKDTGVVFTATTINYDTNSVWLDTTGLDVTKVAAGSDVSYTATSMGSARRVQGAFEQVNNSIASGDLSKVSSDFVHAAGQFQQAPNLQAAQASLQSLSGQLHAVSAAMTFKAIDASSQALSDRFDHVLGKTSGLGMWMQNLNVGGDMGRAGYNGVGFQLNGWLVGSDRKIGRSGVAGFAFGQNRGHQQLNQSYDHDNSRSTEGMLYAGWLSGNWYTQGRVGFGQFQQDVSRRLLLGYSAQNVQTGYEGRYGVAYGESGLRFEPGHSRITPYLNVEYARIGRDGFAEQGAGGFGLRSNAQTLDRWQAGLGVRAGHHWNLDGGRSVDFSMRAQWQRTLASRGDVFDASFVGLREWQPLVGIGLSRYSGLIGIGLDATLSAHTALKFGYDYETGQRDNAQTLSARFKLTF